LHEDRESEEHPEAAAKRRQLDLFYQHRSLLFSIAYRMLGTVADAEDMVQEAFLRWQRVSVSDIDSPRAFLVTIVSRLCINQLQTARTKREEYFGQWLPEPLLTENDPSAAMAMDESLSMGFLVLLERLNAAERAVFLLREVFEYEYHEIASITRLTEGNCRQILRRARQHITEGRPRFDPTPEKRDELLERFLGATVAGDMDGLISILSNDIVLYTDGGGKASAVPEPIYGPVNVSRLLIMSLKKFAPKNLEIRRAQINGQPGILSYANGIAETVIILNIADEHIRNIYIVRNPEKLTRVPPLSTNFVC
jgi:RNA polymerase sigma-70 factor (ECF subfamily)